MCAGVDVGNVQLEIITRSRLQLPCCNVVIVVVVVVRFTMLVFRLGCVVL